MRAQPHHHGCQELGGVLKAQSGLQITQKMVSSGSCRSLQHCLLQLPAGEQVRGFQADSMLPQSHCGFPAER